MHLLNSLKKSLKNEDVKQSCDGIWEGIEVEVGEEGKLFDLLV